MKGCSRPLDDDDAVERAEQQADAGHHEQHAEHAELAVGTCGTRYQSASSAPATDADGGREIASPRRRRVGVAARAAAARALRQAREHEAHERPAPTTRATRPTAGTPASTAGGPARHWSAAWRRRTEPDRQDRADREVDAAGEDDQRSCRWRPCPVVETWRSTSSRLPVGEEDVAAPSRSTGERQHADQEDQDDEAPVELGARRSEPAAGAHAAPASASPHRHAAFDAASAARAA